MDNNPFTFTFTITDDLIVRAISQATTGSVYEDDDEASLSIRKVVEAALARKVDDGLAALMKKVVGG